MTSGRSPLVWIVGRGGLLGGAIADLWTKDSSAVLWPPVTVRWADDTVASAQLVELTRSFLQRAGSERRPWRIVWAAGAGVVATGPEALAKETRVYAAFIEGLGNCLDLDLASGVSGSFFLASSAGGVYGGSEDRPPYDEDSPTGALSPYGREKLAQEAIALQFASSRGVPTLIGRISNLYGPGQDVSKPQGLITQIGRLTLHRRPVPIYVSLDTIRDYLFVRDAALMVTRAIERLEDATERRTGSWGVVKIIASEAETTVAMVLTAWRQVLRRSPGVALAVHQASLLQPRCLSFRSRVWPDLRIDPVPLPIGVHAVFLDQLRRLRLGELP